MAAPSAEALRIARQTMAAYNARSAIADRGRRDRLSGHPSQMVHARALCLTTMLPGTAARVVWCSTLQTAPRRAHACALCARVIRDEPQTYRSSRCRM